MSVVNKTIYALSSGSGRAGIAVIRISGPTTKKTLDILLKSKKLTPRLATLGSIISPFNGDIIDKGIILWFPAPNSYSGEDMAELHIHGGIAVIKAIMHALERLGLSIAQPGEFSRRAFDNNKLDLTEVEAIADLIDAETEAQRKQASKQMSGSLSKLYNCWREKLIKILAYVEAEIDFIDEDDVPDELWPKVKNDIHSLSLEIELHLNDNKCGEILRNGYRIGIAGLPNAGKSSLLNLLSKRDIAIVSEYAGTTRDILESHLDINGYPVILIDTAGIRKTEDLVEQEGVKRAKELLKTVNLILWLQEPDNIENKINSFDIETWQILNKSDLLTDSKKLDYQQKDTLLISTKTGEGIESLISKIGNKLAEEMQVNEQPVITRERHRIAITTCLDCLRKLQNNNCQDIELVAEDIRMAARALSKVIGKIDVEELLGKIFADFCVGK